ncbi:MAG: hypothetical protein HQ498_04510 [Pseudohongiella sp.]|nr:hypothetical protein [Pseudohongiella sp.]
MTKKTKDVIENASIRYLERTKLRASVQAIPYVGGSLDTLLSGSGTKIQSQRLEHFLKELSDRLQKLECAPSIDETLLFDFAIEAMEKSVRTKESKKRELFASIMANQIADPSLTEFSEMALRIVSELDTIHFKILAVAQSAPVCGEPFDGLRLVTVIPYNLDSDGDGVTPEALINKLKEYPEEAIRYAVAELISKGLLRDEGIGRFDATSMEYLVSTSTYDWISELLT